MANFDEVLPSKFAFFLLDFGICRLANGSLRASLRSDSWQCGDDTLSIGLLAAGRLTGRRNDATQ